VLKIVEHEEYVSSGQRDAEAFAEWLVSRLSHTKHPRDRRTDKIWVQYRGKINNTDAIGEGIDEVRSDLKGKTGLADAAGAGQGHEQDIVAKQ
jgi:hypothetical protein